MDASKLEESAYEVEVLVFFGIEIPVQPRKWRVVAKGVVVAELGSAHLIAG